MGCAQGLNKVWGRLLSFEIHCNEKVCERIHVGRLPEMSESKGNYKKRALKCLMHILFVSWGFNLCQHVLRELLGCSRWLAVIGLFREPVESQRPSNGLWTAQLLLLFNFLKMYSSFKRKQNYFMLGTCDMYFTAADYHCFDFPLVLIPQMN